MPRPTAPTPGRKAKLLRYASRFVQAVSILPFLMVGGWAQGISNAPTVWVVGSLAFFAASAALWVVLEQKASRESKQEEQGSEPA